MQFSKLHVFPYSMRTGTASASMPQIDETLKKERSHVLIELSERLEKRYYEKFIGRTLDVLMEEYEGMYTTGFTSNYIKVYLTGNYKLNQLYKCVIDRVEDTRVYGHAISCLNDKIIL